MLHILDVYFYIRQQLKYKENKYNILISNFFLILPIGKPIAKSLLWVQKIAKIPAAANLLGLPINKVITITEKNTILFAISTDAKNNQLTWLRSSCAKDIKMRDGNEKVPIKELIPFASVSEIRFIRPAKYLKGFASVFIKWYKGCIILTHI